MTLHEAMDKFYEETARTSEGHGRAALTHWDEFMAWWLAQEPTADDLTLPEALVLIEGLRREVEHLKHHQHELQACVERPVTP